MKEVFVAGLVFPTASEKSASTHYSKSNRAGLRNNGPGNFRAELRSRLAASSFLQSPSPRGVNPSIIVIRACGGISVNGQTSDFGAGQSAKADNPRKILGNNDIRNAVGQHFTAAGGKARQRRRASVPKDRARRRKTIECCSVILVKLNVNVAGSSASAGEINLNGK